ncbi:unnamed protein product [Rhizophagus irregularis]|nr:unnamed protein product [Rhizophagus irregularis]
MGRCKKIDTSDIASIKKILLYSKYSLAFLSTLFQSPTITFEEIFSLNAFSSVLFLTDKRFGYGPEHATSPFTTDQTSSIGCSSQCSKSSGFLNSSEKAISYACNQSIISCFFVLKV